eukprot:12921430-Prorocentrum_lima.AAC.1
MENGLYSMKSRKWRHKAPTVALVVQAWLSPPAQTPDYTAKLISSATHNQVERGSRFGTQAAIHNQVEPCS